MAGVRGSILEQLWRFVRTYDYVAGDFMWTGIDYLGESRWPGKRRQRRRDRHLRLPQGRLLLLPEPVDREARAAPLPALELEGREGQFIPVTCYTNCDTVELFLNGKSAGVKGYAFPRYGMQGRYGQQDRAKTAVRTTNDLHLEWDVPYEPGTLKAVGTKGGQRSVDRHGRDYRRPAAINLAVDRDTIRADRRDVAHVTVKVVDGEGRVHPDADHEVTFDIQGEGKLIGVDNGNMSKMQDYKRQQKKAFHGMCLAIVQSTGNAGQIRVTATSPGLAGHGNHYGARVDGPRKAPR